MTPEAEDPPAMMSFHPQLLTVMQDLSGWALAGRHADVAAALGRWSEIRSDYSPWAAGASAISRLPTGEDLRQSGLLRLLSSPQLSVVLSRTPSDEVGRLELAFRIEGPDGLLGAEQALVRVVEGMFAGTSEWEPGVLRAILAGVVEAGGLGDLALTVEKVRGGLPGRHFERAREKLHEWTDRFCAYLIRHERQHSFSSFIPSTILPSPFVSEGAKQWISEGASSEWFPECQRDLALIWGLRDFLETRVYPALPGGGTLFLTELLQEAPERKGPAVSCALSPLFAAHLARAARIEIDSLIHNCSHVSLALRRSPLVIGTESGSKVFRTVDEWKKAGLLGKGQKPGPLTDLLSSYVNSVVGLRGLQTQDSEVLRQGFEASSRICPDHFGVLINRAHLNRDRPEVTRGLIDRLSALDPANPWIPYLEAYSYKAWGQSGAALSTFEYAFRKCAEDGIKTLDQVPVPLVMPEHLEPAIDDYVRLGLELGDRLRVQTTLRHLHEYPDRRIRSQALMLLMMLSGQGAQA